MSVTTTKSDYIRSPVGELQFLALNNKVAKDLKPDSDEGYAVRLKFTTATPEGAQFKKDIAAINANLIGTKHVNNKNEYTVRAFSKFLPVVVDSNDNEMEELPNFYSESTGTASMVVLPYMGNAMGGSLTLQAIKIEALEVGEAPTDKREETVNKIKALLAGKKD